MSTTVLTAPPPRRRRAATAAPRTPAMPEPAERRVLLENVDWKSYIRIRRIFADRPAIRMAYDRGSLEIMTISLEHDNPGHLLNRFIIALTEEMGMPIKGGGRTTMKRMKKKKGIESDECYWIQNEKLMRGKRKLDLRTDPPPDLGVEIDISYSSLDRLAIYAGLGVREVWRYDGHHLVFHLLEADGHYVTSKTSRAFPGLKADDVARFLVSRVDQDENGVTREFRGWVRQQIAAGWPA